MRALSFALLVVLVLAVIVDATSLLHKREARMARRHIVTEGTLQDTAMKLECIERDASKGAYSIYCMFLSSLLSSP